jgi:hypothetical protein
LAALHCVMKLLVCNSQLIRRKKYILFIYFIVHTCDTMHVRFTTQIFLLEFLGFSLIRFKFQGLVLNRLRPCYHELSNHIIKNNLLSSCQFDSFVTACVVSSAWLSRALSQRITSVQSDWRNMILTLVANSSSIFVSFDSTPVFLLDSVTSFRLAHNYKHTRFTVYNI